MAEYSYAQWLMLVYVFYGSVLSSQSLSYEEQMSISTFECKLNITETTWTLECESQDFNLETSAKFLMAKLQGSLRMVSPLSYNELLNSTCIIHSELYSCDRQWKFLLDTDKSFLLHYCQNYKKYLQSFILNLNESSVRSLNVSHVSKPFFALNILPECSHLEDVLVAVNYIPLLSSLPSEADNSITSLSMKKNGIENITDSVFHLLRNLSRLDLSHNLLRDIRKKLFDGLSALSQLDLSHNRIESVSSDAFSQLPLLKNILLVNNNLRYIRQDLFRFNNLLSLIDLSSNDVKHLPATLFNNISSLKTISCSNCSLHDWDKDMFLQSENLIWIDFTFNHLQVVHVEMFRPLNLLQGVELGNNNISDLKENLFPNHPFLVLVNLANNKISSFKNAFTGAPNIRRLDLTGNRIKTLTDDHIKNFTDLENFRLRQNKLVSVELGIKTQVKVRKIDLSDNYINKLNVAWKRLTYLENFNMDNNQLTSINLPPCIPSVKQTLTFSFRYNKISTVNMELLISDEERVKVDRTMTGCFFNGMAKNFVELTHNPLLCDCKLYPFYEYVRKKSPRRYQLDMLIDKGNLTCANPPFLKDNDLISLPDDILSCPISENCPSSCSCGTRGKDNLVFVNCSSSYLEEVPQIAPEGTTVLYINDNNLTSMASLNTNVWSKLRELHVDNNWLTDLDDWKFPESIRYLSVRGNKLKTLPNQLMQFISNLADFYLFFGNNDQNCDCDRENMKHFLLQNIQFVQDNEDILCVVKNNDTSTLLQLTSIPDSNLCPQTAHNLNLHPKKLVVALCVFFILLIMLVLLYYRHRQLILSFFYIHCDDLFRLFYFEENDGDKIFDAFVAYSSNDRDIVLELLQELEDNAPHFRLCIHERNWVPGHFITDNIVNSVENSRRTIVILSNTFVSSPWFNIEVRAAVFKMSKDKMNKIIVILTDKSVSLDSIDPEIRHVISKRTYLVWGERWFWEKLRYVMPRKRTVKRTLWPNQSSSSISEMTLVSDTI